MQSKQLNLLRDDDSICSALDDSYTDFVDTAVVDQVEVALGRLRQLDPTCPQTYSAGDFTRLQHTCLAPSSPQCHPDRGSTMAALLLVGAQLEGKQDEAARIMQASPLRDLRETLKHFFDFTLFYTDFSRLSVLNSVDGALRGGCARALHGCPSFSRC